MPSITTSAGGVVVGVGVGSGVKPLMIKAPFGPAEMRCPLTVISEPGIRVCDPMMKLELKSMVIV